MEAWSDAPSSYDMPKMAGRPPTARKRQGTIPLQVPEGWALLVCWGMTSTLSRQIATLPEPALLAHAKSESQSGVRAKGLLRPFLNMH